MINNFDLNDFKRYLAFKLEKPQKYLSYLETIQSREKCDLLFLVNNLTYFKYKYKYGANDLRQGTKRCYGTALNTLSNYLNPKCVELTFKVENNDLLSIDNYLIIIQSLNELFRSELFFSCDSYNIKKIKKGSTIFVLGLSTALLSIYLTKAIKVIQELAQHKDGEELNAKRVGKGILHAAIIILNVASVFLPLGQIEALGITLTTELIQWLIDQIIDLL